MADEITAEDEEAAPASPARRKAAAKTVKSVKKVSPRKAGAAKAPRKSPATKKAVGAKGAAARKAPAKKAGASKRAAPAKRKRPPKEAPALLLREEEATDAPVEAVEPTEAADSVEPAGSEPVEPHPSGTAVDQLVEERPERPPPPVPVPEPAREKKGKTKLLVALVALLGLALLAGGAYLVADLISNNDDGVGYTSLKPGDCFNNPPDNFKRVTTVPCTGPHDLEVVAVVTDPSPKKAPYPGTAALVQTASERCAADFQIYVGRPVEQSQFRQVEIVPQKASWDDGGRRLVCTIRSPDGAPSTGSARGSNR